MQLTSVKQFYIIGLSIRTTNKDGKSATDMRELWNRFINENVSDQIPNKIDDSIYCVYTDYEGDFTKPFTAIIGCKVSSLEEIPDGFTAKIIDGGNYNLLTAKGKIEDGIVFLEWIKVLRAKIQRIYTTDFEVYTEKSKDPEHAEVDIFVSVK